HTHSLTHSHSLTHTHTRAQTLADTDTQIHTPTLTTPNTTHTPHTTHTHTHTHTRANPPAVLVICPCTHSPVLGLAQHLPGPGGLQDERVRLGNLTLLWRTKPRL